MFCKQCLLFPVKHKIEFKTITSLTFLHCMLVQYIYTAFLDALRQLNDPTKTAFQSAQALLQNMAMVRVTDMSRPLKCRCKRGLLSQSFHSTDFSSIVSLCSIHTTTCRLVCVFRCLTWNVRELMHSCSSCLKFCSKASGTIHEPHVCVAQLAPSISYPIYLTHPVGVIVTLLSLQPGKLFSRRRRYFQGLEHNARGS